MKIYNLLQMFRLVILILLLLNFSSCHKEQLTSTVILCDHFTSSGECLEPLQENHVYHIDFPISKKLNTWDDFANYLYFKTRQTPGIVIKFNRKLTIREKKSLHDSFQVSYDFAGATGQMEGREIGDDFAGSFHYLGSMIKQKQKAENKNKYYPNPATLFPVTLQLDIKSDLFQISKKINLMIELKYIP